MTRYKITAEMAIEFHDLLGPDLEIQGIRDRGTLDYIVDQINGEEDVFRRAAWALYLAAACPQGHRAQGGGQHGGGEVDGNSGAEVRQGRQGGGHGVHLCGMAGMDVTVPLSPRRHHRFAMNCTVMARNAGGLPRGAVRFGRGAQVLHRLGIDAVPSQDAARR